jgi:hypothetical protein
VSSCSSLVDVVQDFVGRDATLVMAQVMNGKDIPGYTNFPGENEVPLRPGTRLRVAAGTFDHAGGLRVVHLKDVSEEGDEELSSVSSAGDATGTKQTDLSQSYHPDPHPSPSSYEGKGVGRQCCTHLSTLKYTLII